MDDFWLKDDRDELNDPSLYPGAEPARIATLATRLRERSRNLLQIDSVEESDLEANAILSEAYNLDNKTLSTWSWQCQQSNDTFALKLPTRTVRSPGSEHIWRGRVDLYEDLKNAMVFNSFRLDRIYIQSVIIRCLARLSTTEEELYIDPQYQQACKTMQSLVDDICACVPTYLAEDEAPTSPDSENEANEHAKIVRKGLGAYCMMFPVYAASSIEIISDEQRQWLRGRLLALAEVHGVKLAAWLSRLPADMIFGRVDPNSYYFRNA